MLEQDARQKLCPYKLNNGNSGLQKCEGLGCMGWDELTNPVWQFPKEQGHKRGRIVAKKPKEPAEGYCAMVPPTEVYLNQ